MRARGGTISVALLLCSKSFFHPAFSGMVLVTMSSMLCSVFPGTFVRLGGRGGPWCAWTAADRVVDAGLEVLLVHLFLDIRLSHCRMRARGATTSVAPLICSQCFFHPVGIYRLGHGVDVRTSEMLCSVLPSLTHVAGEDVPPSATVLRFGR